ncbi:ferredoxin [Pluteus cervinus]|uniref:Ferredoxin n=1 Tax=Pluteus cervinus TaxID=181527 RepID=A0ACD3AZF7_9AGAR|nr:ferredoxin [Pluteus cervinus]
MSTCPGRNPSLLSVFDHGLNFRVCHSARRLHTSTSLAAPGSSPQPKFRYGTRGFQPPSVHLWGSSSQTLGTGKAGASSESRHFHSSSIVSHGGIERPEPGTGIKIHFKDSKGNLIRTVEANEGDDLLTIAHEYDIDLEGACEGSVACSTCHVILPQEYYDLLPEPEDDENDMLDMAFGLTDTSRLGCQVKLTKELDGITATLPAATRNMFVDGKKPTHH